MRYLVWWNHIFCPSAGFPPAHPTPGAREAVSKKPKDKQMIIVKSWNEWGEGNHLEPDLKYGRGYLEAIKEAKEKFGVRSND